MRRPHPGRPSRTACLVAASIALSLGGCATLNEDECRRGDWYQLGRDDGARGELPDYLNAHREACAEYGIGPDVAAWERGRKDGLVGYCTRIGGLRAGRAGQGYRNVCPPEREADFLAGFEVGRVIHEYQTRIDRLRSDLSNNDRLIAKANLDDRRRDELRASNRNLRREILALEALLFVQHTRATELER